MKTVCLWFEKPTSLAMLAEHCLRLSPQISLRKNQALFIEIGKCRWLYTEEGFFARLAVLLRRFKLSPAIAVGTNIPDALAMARFQTRSLDETPLWALLDLTDPFDRDEVLQRNVTELVLSFSDLGIRTIGDFKKIPPGELVSRFGVLGRHCADRAHGKDEISWPLWTPPEVVQARKDFEPAMYGVLEPLFFELKTQLDGLFQRLWARGLKVRKMRVLVHCEKNSRTPKPTRKFDFEFFAPQSSSRGTIKIIRERLTREFEKTAITSPIESLETEITATIAANAGQKNMLDQTEEKLEQINSLHNQLVEIFGAEATYQAEVVADRRPEKSWRKVFSTPHEAPKNTLDLRGVIPQRPIYLLKKPLKIEVTRDFIYIQKRRHRILRWGKAMEKISGGWFEHEKDHIENTYDRNYHRIEIQGHQKLLIFEAPQNTFYLHGYDG